VLHDERPGHVRHAASVKPPTTPNGARQCRDVSWPMNRHGKSERFLVEMAGMARGNVVFLPKTRPVDLEIASEGPKPNRCQRRYGVPAYPLPAYVP